MAELSEIVRHCDGVLKTAEFTDWEGAVNGLQMENRGRVTRIAAAVDGTPATIRLAIEAGADLLVVHHGLFWSKTHPWTGSRYAMIRALVENNLAVYSSHLPLDAHPKLGNNALLCAALGLKRLRPFFFEKGRYLGFRGELKITRADLAGRLEKILGGPVKLLPGGDTNCRSIGVVTGGAGAEMGIAAKEGVDAFVTGEGPHWTYAVAEGLGLNVFYGGHYATETFGVKALSEHLSRKFRVPWEFIDHPTGL